MGLPPLSVAPNGLYTRRQHSDSLVVGVLSCGTCLAYFEGTWRGPCIDTVHEFRQTNTHARVTDPQTLFLPTMQTDRSYLSVFATVIEVGRLVGVLAHIRVALLIDDQLTRQDIRHAQRGRQGGTVNSISKTIRFSVAGSRIYTFSQLSFFTLIHTYHITTSPTLFPKLVIGPKQLPQPNSRLALHIIACGGHAK